MSVWQFVWYGGLLITVLFFFLAWPKKNDDGVLPNRKVLDRETVAALSLIMLGLVLRIVYIKYTNVYTRQHDVSYFDSGRGHSGYIYYFVTNNFRLPDFSPASRSQFYHPPLHHLIAAWWVRLRMAGGISAEAAMESVQVLTCLYSFGCLPVFWVILKKIGLKGYSLLLPLALFCTAPGLIIMGGDINNDMLTNFLTLCAFAAAICWYQKSTLPRILLCAACMGLAMMAKLSAVLAAPVIAYLFLDRFFGEKNRKIKGYIFSQFIAFFLVCAPLGLWWPLYCNFKWDVPLGYVPRLSDSANQYIGNYTFIDRTISFSKQDFEKIFIGWWDQAEYGYNEHNIFVGLLKTSLFDESTLFRISGKSGRALHNNQIGLRAATTLFYVHIPLIAISLAGEVAVLVRAIKAKKYKPLWIALAVFPVVVFISFMFFCFNFPHTCSMNFRYTVPLQYCGMAFLGLWMQQKPRTKVVGFIKNIGVSVLGAMFIFCSVMTIVWLGKV